MFKRKIAVLIVILLSVLGTVSAFLNHNLVGDYEERSFSVSGISLTLLKRAGVSPKGIVIFFHGFSGNKENLKSLAYALASTGFLSVLVDLPGHGSSEGSMVVSLGGARVSQFEWVFNVTVRFVRAKGFDLSRIAVVGHSMGGALACYLGIRFRFIDAVVGIAPAIGMFPDVAPENFSVDKPRNTLFVVGQFDFIINNSAVVDAFKRTTAGRYREDELLLVGGGYKSIHRVKFADHIGIIFSDDTIRYVVWWLSYVLLGHHEESKFNVPAFLVTIYLSVLSFLAAFMLIILNVLSYEGSPSQVKIMAPELYKDRRLWIHIAYGLPLTIILIIVLAIVTGLVVSSVVAGIFLAYSIVLWNYRREKARIDIKLRDIALGLILGSIPILIIELFLGHYVASLVGFSARRVLGVVVFGVVSFFTFLLLESSAGRESSPSLINFVILSIDYGLLLLPTLIIALIIGLPMIILVPFLMMLTWIYLVVISALMSLGAMLGKLTPSAKTISGALIYAVLLSTFTPIIIFAY